MTTINFFDNKTTYQKFRAAWAQAVNSENAKSTLVPCDEYVEVDGRWRTSIGTGKCRKTGWINAEHHIVYNILRYKQVDFGFAKSDNAGKKNNFRIFLSNLKNICVYAERLNRGDKLHDYAIKLVNNFLEPFGGFVGYEHLAACIPYLDGDTPVPERPKYEPANTSLYGITEEDVDVVIKVTEAAQVLAREYFKLDPDLNESDIDEAFMDESGDVRVMYSYDRGGCDGWYPGDRTIPGNYLYESNWKKQKEEHLKQVMIEKAEKAKADKERSERNARNHRYEQFIKLKEEFDTDNEVVAH